MNININHKKNVKKKSLMMNKITLALFTLLIVQAQTTIFAKKRTHKTQKKEKRKKKKILKSYKQIMEKIHRSKAPDPPSKQVGNVEYIQLFTVNQFDKDVNTYVNKKYNSLAKNGLLNKSKTREAFSPNATCAWHAIRNALCFFRTLHAQDIFTKIMHLEKINNDDHAKSFLKKIIDYDLETSSLQSDFIEKAIKEFKDTKEALLANRTTVVDSVLSAEFKIFQEITDRFANNNNYFHLFIVNTGYMNQYLVKDYIKKFAQESGYKVNRKVLKKFASRENKKNHYYVAAIEKKDNRVKYFIMDTIPGNNHIEDKNLYDIDKFLCDYILTGHSRIKLKEKVHNGIVHDAMKAGAIQANINQVISKKPKAKNNYRKKRKKKKEIISLDTDLDSKKPKKSKPLNMHPPKKKPAIVKPHRKQITQHKNHTSTYSPEPFQRKRYTTIGPWERYINSIIKVGNVEYIQLFTVDQFDGYVNTYVNEKYNSLAKNGLLNSKTREAFSPNATCAWHAIRNALWFFRALYAQDALTKKMHVEKISNDENAKMFLKYIIDRGIRPSWLQSDRIEQALKAFATDSALRQAQDDRVLRQAQDDREEDIIADRTTVIDSVLSAETGIFQEITDRFAENENYFHIFIVNTGYMNQYLVRDYILRFAQESGCKINRNALKRFASYKNKKNHYYVAAIEKKGNRVKHFILDTIPGNNHLINSEKNNINKKLYDINRFLCDYMLHGRSRIKLKEEAHNAIMHEAMQAGIIQVNTNTATPKKRNIKKEILKKKIEKNAKKKQKSILNPPKKKPAKVKPHRKKTTQHKHHAYTYSPKPFQGKRYTTIGPWERYINHII